jgi:hypothetical protein
MVSGLYRNSESTEQRKKPQGWLYIFLSFQQQVAAYSEATSQFDSTLIRAVAHSGWPSDFGVNLSLSEQILWATYTKKFYCVSLFKTAYLFLFTETCRQLWVSVVAGKQGKFLSYQAVILAVIVCF